MTDSDTKGVYKAAKCAKFIFVEETLNRSFPVTYCFYLWSYFWYSWFNPLMTTAAVQKNFCYLIYLQDLFLLRFLYPFLVIKKFLINGCYYLHNLFLCSWYFLVLIRTMNVVNLDCGYKSSVRNIGKGGVMAGTYHYPPTL